MVTRPITSLSRLPSIFAQVRYERDHLLFLRQFVESITEPVEHDGREHIDYVASQIVTEYFRHRYRMDKKIALDGIIYPSAQRRCGRSAVIFAAPSDLNPHPNDWIAEQPTPILTFAQEQSGAYAERPDAALRSYSGRGLLFCGVLRFAGCGARAAPGCAGLRG
jgi:hypothetical protein